MYVLKEVYVQITATVHIHLTDNVSQLLWAHILEKYVTALLLCVKLK